MLQNPFLSNVRVALLTHSFTHPGQRFCARELARRLARHANAVWPKLGNLIASVRLASEQNTGANTCRLNPDFPLRHYGARPVQSDRLLHPAGRAGRQHP